MVLNHDLEKIKSSGNNVTSL